VEVLGQDDDGVNRERMGSHGLAEGTTQGVAVVGKDPPVAVGQVDTEEEGAAGGAAVVGHCGIGLTGVDLQGFMDFASLYPSCIGVSVGRGSQASPTCWENHVSLR